MSKKTLFSYVRKSFFSIIQKIYCFVRYNIKLQTLIYQSTFLMLNKIVRHRGLIKLDYTSWGTSCLYQDWTVNEQHHARMRYTWCREYFGETSVRPKERERGGARGMKRRERVTAFSIEAIRTAPATVFTSSRSINHARDTHARNKC